MLAAGVAGALAGQAAGIPAGTMIGALLSSGLYRLLAGRRLDPAATGLWRRRYGRLGRLLLGTAVGAAFGPEVVGPLKSALLPMAALIVAIVAVGLALGWILSRLTGLDRATAIISAIPGGLPAMTAMAEEVDADATVVAAIHFSRLTTILVMVPLLIPWLAGKSGVVAGIGGLAATGEPPASLAVTALTLALGLGGGLLAVAVGLPTADLVGPILAVGGANLLGAGLGGLHPGFRQAAMLAIGISVGAQMAPESLRKLRQVALPAAGIVVTLIGTGLLLGWGLEVVTSLDPVSALLSGVPGGASTMPII
ncbi:MAG: AbrB family transcriptional regulator, partial [Anaerolineae bacterium]